MIQSPEHTVAASRQMGVEGRYGRKAAAADASCRPRRPQPRRASGAGHGDRSKSSTARRRPAPAGASAFCLDRSLPAGPAAGSARAWCMAGKRLATLMAATPPSLILASASPARLRVMRGAGLRPEVEVSGVDEADIGAETTRPHFLGPA